MYYYKNVIDGIVNSIFTCDGHLGSSETQVEITESEYAEILDNITRQIQNEVEEAESEDV